MPVREIAFREAVFKVLDEGRPFDYGWVDEQDVRDRWWHIQPGEVVLDVGAAMGSYAIPACALGARVYAWSPDHCASALVENILVNDFGNRCTVIRAGLFNRVGWLEPYTQRFLTEPPDSLTAAIEFDGHPIESEYMPVSTLDRFVFKEAQLDRVDWIKLDVEGAEVEVLNGALQTINDFWPKILVENHLFKDGEIGNKVRDLLLRQRPGYTGVEIPYHSVSHAMYTPKARG